MLREEVCVGVMEERRSLRHVVMMDVTTKPRKEEYAEGTVRTSAKTLAFRWMY